MVRDKGLRVLCVLLAGIFIFAGPASPEVPLRTSLVLPSDLETSPTLRVAILQNVEKASLEFSSPYTVVHPATGEILAEGLAEKDVVLNPSRDGIRLGRTVIHGPVLRVNTEDEMIQVDGKAYRAALQVRKSTNGKLILINEISIEDYLKGVLPSEVDRRWNIEALKAQAVASRTFALFQALKDPEAPFSLTSDVKSQVYGGKNVEHLRTSEAVDATRGQVLTYRGLIFPAYFHSSCGGRTTQAESVWKVRPIPPLSGTQCGFCGESKYDSWAAEFSFEEIARKFSDRGIRFRQILDIEGIDRDRSGRIKKVFIHHPGGIYKMVSSEFRLVVGADRMRSTRVTFRTNAGMLRMSGKGWGHGVGLCQWGTKAMSEQSYGYENILHFYYPSSQITQAYSSPDESSSGNIVSKWWGKFSGLFG